MPARSATAAIVAVLAAAPAASAKPHDSKRLWATVNVCDTAANPNEIGIRASMPGVRERTRLLMRFRVQYFAAADQTWHNFSADTRTDSGWVEVGRQRGGVVESGWNVSFKPPAAGGSHLLRGSVHFRWRRDGKALHATRRITESGHRSTTGSDPEGYSAATCRIA